MADSYPLYSTIDLITGFSDAALTIMYRGKRFHIQVFSNRLGDPKLNGQRSPLQEKFQYFLENVDEEPQVMEELEEWIVEPCLTIIRQATPADYKMKEMSTQEYFAPITIQLMLINSHGTLAAVKQPLDASLLRYLTPNTPSTDGLVLSALQQGIQCILASSLVIVRANDVDEQEENAMPKEVKDHNGHRYYFKAAFDRGSFNRELTAMLRIRKEDTHNELKVSRLAAVVQMDGEESVLGLLLDFIEHTGTLSEHVWNGASDQLRQKWSMQIEESVAKLHSMSIVWGDVKPDNVLINSKEDAVVIDFGGGFAPQWVDKALENSKEGDLQGVSKIRKFLEDPPQRV